MNAKEITELTGISRDTLRYYEKEGLLGKVERSANGYRRYSPVNVKQLKFIRYAQSVGFPLSKIKLAIPHLENPKPDCPLLQQAVREQLAAIDEKMEELLKAKETLSKWIMPQ